MTNTIFILAQRGKVLFCYIIAVLLLLYWIPEAGSQPLLEAETNVGEKKSADVSVGKTFMAVTANRWATAAAYQMLNQGGNAVDAAIAAQMVLGLVEPQSSGIGGGGFMLYWHQAHKTLEMFDGRETAPASADEELFLDSQGQPMEFMQALVGGLSVGTPGLLRMLATAHAQYGRLPWQKLFEPAIALANVGFKLSPRVALLLKHVPQIAVRKPITGYFFDKDGQPLKAGTLIVNREYGNTLSLVAKRGVDAFYQGDIAEAIVKTVNNDANPGLLSLGDMRNYQAVIREPLCHSYRDYRICSTAPPSSGGSTVLSIVGMFAHLNLTKAQSISTDNHFSPKFIHLFAETSRLAFADRNAYLGDSDFVAVPLKRLLSEQYLKQRAALINTRKAMTEIAPGKILGYPTGNSKTQEKGLSTTHLSIIDSDGNALSMTTSIETAFGSRLMVKGILLNNQLTDFDFSPQTPTGTLSPNRVTAKKRPRSSMSPTIVLKNNRPVMLLGSPGGSSIIDFVAQTILNHLFLEMPLAEAVTTGRIVHKGDQLQLEKGQFSPQQVEELQHLGHHPRASHLNSGIQAIVVLPSGTLVGVADPRREGKASGK